LTKIDPFQTSPLGTTAVRLPKLGLGTFPIGGWPKATSESQALDTIERAWQAGIRYYDTAPFYGHGLSEEHLGRLLPSFPRDQFLVSTKVGRLLVDGPPGETLFEGIPQRRVVPDLSYSAALASLEASRARLGLDRIDIALVHDPEQQHDEAMHGAYRALVDLRKDGVLSAIGVGMNWSRPLARFVSEGEFDCVLCAGRYSLLEQDSLDDLLPLALERSVSVILGGVFNSGLLIAPGPGSTYNYAPAPPEVIDRAQQLETTCRQFDVPLRAAALQFAMAHPAVTTVVVGARTPAEVNDTLALFATPVPADLWEALRRRGLVREDAPAPTS
jgi:D-threo-aldose 1-dehydrogenase